MFCEVLIPLSLIISNYLNSVTSALIHNAWEHMKPRWIHYFDHAKCVTIFKAFYNSIPTFSRKEFAFWLSETVSSGVLTFAYHCCGLVVSLPGFPKGALPHSHPQAHLWRSLPLGDFQMHFHYTTSNSSHEDFSSQSPCTANCKW